MLPPKQRPRRRAWLFAKKGNRRVRLTKSARPRKPFSWKPLLAIGVVIAFGGAAFGVHHFLTHSRHFAVRALRFSTTKHVTSESLAARAGEVIGLNLFRADLDELQRDVLQEPWIATVHARRELPSTLVVDVTEREAAAGVALGPIYLVDMTGTVFKRSTPEEAANLPVVTGVERDLYLADPDSAKEQIREAIAAIDAWGKTRPAIGEAHADKLLGLTLYTVENGVGIRLGRGEDLLTRLKRFDAVWAALQGEKPRLIYLDNRARPDRVTVKLAPPPPVQKKTKAKTEVVPTAVSGSPEERDS
jgi:cell division protein FtsQ